MVRSPFKFYNRAKPLIARLSQALPFSGRSVLIASLVATTLVTGVKKLGSLQQLELFIFDSLIRLQTDQGQDPRLVVVGITESDIQQYSWPLSDQELAKLLQTIQKHQPQVVGLDLYRKNSYPPGQLELEQQLAEDNLIAITNVGSAPQIGKVPPPDTVPWERVGFNDLSIDPDGVIRRSLLFVNHSEKLYYAFALRVALASLPNADDAFTHDSEAIYLNGHPINRLRAYSGGYQNIDSRGFQTLLRYRSRHSLAKQISVGEVLRGDFDPSLFQDKIVLIGSIAPSLKDEFYTPYSASRDNRFTMSGVVVHAQIISQLLDIANGDASHYRFFPMWGEFAWLIGWVTLTSILGWKIRRPEILFLVGTGLFLSIFGVSWFTLNQLIWVPLLEPFLGVLIAGGLVVTQKVIYQSTHDGLTELPGREVFLLYVRRALNTQSTQPVIVAFLDVDRFQIINKSLGHYAGDRVLIEIAQRLVKSLGEHAKVTRVGGDEFAILFHDSSLPKTEERLDKIRSILSSPLMLGKHRLSITASIGIAITQTQYGQTPEDILRDAHTAMYRAKALDEAQYQVFSNDMREEAVARLDLESDLIKALEENEFSLFYQPIINIQSGVISGFEALIRWHQEERGLISPSQFIPIVEETGMIIPLGEWIFKTAFQQIKTWNQQFPDLALKMSINLSRRQFDQPDLYQKIDDLLTQLELPGEYIQLEITESMIMRDVEASHEFMLKLKALGIQLAIDDFGTGYSSLSYLHRFPTDTLKIDQSFVSSMENSSEDREIVQTIISLGQKLNMDLVAEGISSSQQLALLKAANCQFGQGYHFAKPLPAKDATALLEKRNGWLEKALPQFSTR
ncbi:MAG: EAL domain-containing protein [Leptolyngbya sp. SIO1D8]|nr:EAL domain-containing protein [Leptolyngbya sp. SIO1D8]